MGFATTTLIRFSSPLAWAAIALAAMLSLLGPSTVRKLWRKERRYDPPASWPWGAPLWRGYTRILLVSAIGVPLLTLTVVLGRLAPKHTTSALYWVAVVLSALSVLEVFVLLPGVVLFSQPKFLIPPLLRSQPGAISEWVTRWSGRRPRRS